MTKEQFPRSIADLGVLSPAEQIVLNECCAGEEAHLSNARPLEMTDQNRVRSGLIRLLMLGGEGEHTIHERGVWIEGAWIDGEIDLDFCTCVCSLSLFNCTIPEGITCALATLAQLSLEGTQTGPVFAQGAKVNGGVFLRSGFQSHGEVRFSGMQIGGQLSLMGAALDNPNGKAFAGQGIRVGGDTFFTDGFKAKGEIDLNGADFERLSFNTAKLENKHGDAVSLHHANIATSLLWWDVEVADGSIDLRGLHLDMLEDQPENWPDNLRMDGFTYNQIMQNTDLKDRLAWLAKNKSTDFKPQPYQQLAKVLGDIGHRLDRARVLRDMENGIRAQQRKELSPPRSWFKRLGDEIMRIVVGYGYFPGRALIVGLILILVTWAGISYVAFKGDMTPTAAPVLMSAEWQALASSETPNPAKIWAANDGPGRDYETLRPLLYAFDVVVPLINIGQESTWGPSTSRSFAGIVAHWAMPIVKTLGWIITALGAAAVTGTIRRD